jgi:hypothetical protein
MQRTESQEGADKEQLSLDQLETMIFMNIFFLIETLHKNAAALFTGICLMLIRHINIHSVFKLFIIIDIKDRF